MIYDAHQKVTVTHLKRNAYLYIRQSTIRQVFENTESTKRQYALQQNAVALGWSQEKIIIIDSDLGQSGASAVDREGFQRLVAEVGMGRAGIVLGLEVSRLARNSTDWHRLLEICALTDTLILDKCEAFKNVESFALRPMEAWFRTLPKFTFLTGHCRVFFSINRSTNERRRHADPTSAKGTLVLSISARARPHCR